MKKAQHLCKRKREGETIKGMNEYRKINEKINKTIVQIEIKQKGIVGTHCLIEYTYVHTQQSTKQAEEKKERVKTNPSKFSLNK